MTHFPVPITFHGRGYQPFTFHIPYSIYIKNGMLSNRCARICVNQKIRTPTVRACYYPHFAGVVGWGQVEWLSAASGGQEVSLRPASLKDGE